CSSTNAASRAAYSSGSSHGSRAYFERMPCRSALNRVSEVPLWVRLLLMSFHISRSRFCPRDHHARPQSGSSCFDLRGHTGVDARIFVTRVSDHGRGGSCRLLRLGVLLHQRARAITAL